MRPEKSTTDHRPPTMDPRRSQLACLDLSVHLTNLPAVVNGDRGRRCSAIDQRPNPRPASPHGQVVECSSQLGAYEGTKGRIVMLRATCASFHHNLDWDMSGRHPWCKARITRCHHAICIPGCPVKSNVTSPCPVFSLLRSFHAWVGVSIEDLGFLSWWEADGGTQQLSGSTTVDYWRELHAACVMKTTDCAHRRHDVAAHPP
jgi:hypothetical protein